MTLATQIVHWPGQDTPACEEHAGKLKHLAAFMGFSVSCTPCPPNIGCSNCDNELTKAARERSEKG